MAPVRGKIEDYLRFLTHAGETRFPNFAWESLRKFCHLGDPIWLMLKITLKIVKVISDSMRTCRSSDSVFFLGFKENEKNNSKLSFCFRQGKSLKSPF